jgi:hypothetical protein
MLESHPGVANLAVADLTEAGHTVVRCDTEDRRVPCRGLAAGGECPLDEHVDVAVIVQENGSNRVAPGAICAARSRVPVVEVDPTDDAACFTANPWRPVAAADLIDECERAAHDGSAHAQVVVDRLLSLGVLAFDEVDGPAATIAIAVTRDGGRLHMTIELADSVRDREAELVRAATQALRGFDRRAAVIDVSVRR